ncbi:MAG: site-specific integrase [bacterium]|nr:site-specific integrase [bacterium]
MRWCDPASGRWRSESCGSDRRRAQSVAAHKREALAAGIDNDLIRVTWKKFCTRVIEAKAVDVRDSSLAEYRRTLDQFTTVVNPMAPDRVRHEDVKKFLGARKQAGDRDATREKHRTNLRLLFNEGKRLRHLQRNPVDGVKKIKSESRDWHLYEPNEIDALLASADAKTWAPMIYLAYTTGLRKGELLHLTWADVDTVARVVKVNPKRSNGTLLEWSPKDHERRVVPLTDYAVDLLQRMNVAADPENPHVLLPTARYRVLLTQDYRGRNPMPKFTERWRKLCETAGVPVGEFHWLRKSCITRWLEDGVRPHETQQFAGHSDIQTTIRYYSKVRGKGMESARTSSAKYVPGGRALRKSRANSVG